MYRQVADSSGFTEPRVLARVFVERGRLEEAVRFYEDLTEQPVDLELDARDQGMHLVAIGGFLLLDVDDTLLGRAELARATSVTMIVAHLEPTLERAVTLGAERVGGTFEAPTGRGARLRHPDGTLVEYLEHRPGPDDVAQPATPWTANRRSSAGIPSS